ncbi:MAG: hypothetical protein ACOYNC_10140 [Bacteroidales bacterium]
MTIITLLTGLFLASTVAFSQQVTLKMKNGKEIKGVLLSLETNLVAIDPDGSVTYLSLSSVDLESLTFIDGTVLNYPITQEMIPEKYRNRKVKTSSNSEGHYYKSYVEMYLLGGYSSRTNLMNVDIEFEDGSTDVVSMIYKNGGLGGLGFSWMELGRDRRPDVMVDFELSMYGTKMLMKYHTDEVELMSGLALCMDLHFTIFPIKARNKYPSPFIFAGIGGRLVGMSTSVGESSSVSEFHGELPFGIGLRQKITKGFAIQIRERFVYSKLKDADGFILPETRFELVFTIGKS